jgi:hypothetical protein
MTGGDDDYGDAFKEAKLEHDQRRQGSAKEQRLQAEADAAAAALSNVVLPQLQAASEKLEPLGGSVDIRRYGRTGKSLRPTSVAFRITDQQGHKSRVYLIVPQAGTVTVTSGDGFGLTGEPQQAVNVSEKVSIQKVERGMAARRFPPPWSVAEQGVSNKRRMWPPGQQQRQQPDRGFASVYGPPPSQTEPRRQSRPVNGFVPVVWFRRLVGSDGETAAS